MPDLKIGGVSIAPGQQQTIDVPVAPMYTHDDLSISIQVIRGKRPGPTLFISAAIHGDEINGVEIIRRVLQHRSLRNIRGSLVAMHGPTNHLGRIEPHQRAFFRRT